MSNKNGTQGDKHEIRKRTIDPLAWLWQIPSLYGFCAVAANVNSALGVKLGSKLTGPVNIKGCKEEQVRQCLGFCTADFLVLIGPLMS